MFNVVYQHLRFHSSFYFWPAPSNWKKKAGFFLKGTFSAKTVFYNVIIFVKRFRGCVAIFSMVVVYSINITYRYKYISSWFQGLLGASTQLVNTLSLSCMPENLLMLLRKKEKTLFQHKEMVRKWVKHTKPYIIQLPMKQWPLYDLQGTV